MCADQLMPLEVVRLVVKTSRNFCCWIKEQVTGCRKRSGAEKVYLLRVPTNH